MKKILIVVLAALTIAAGCKKKESSTPTPPGPTPVEHPYYFKFKLDGVSYNLNSNEPQYVHFYSDEVGGYQDADSAFFPAAGLSLLWEKDTVLESDLMALKGQTLHFNDTAVRAVVTFDKDLSTPNWYSEDTANALYFVKITDVVYLKKDTVLGTPLKIYVITGSCSAVVDNGTSRLIFSEGEFHFRVSRQDH